MKKFSQFISEAVQKKALHVFDIDDTLMHTTAKIHVIRAGNLNKEGAPADKKAVVIHGYIKKHKYNDVHMYDDSKTNLRSFVGLKQAHPNTTFHAHHVEGENVTTKVV